MILEVFSDFSNFWKKNTFIMKKKPKKKKILCRKFNWATAQIVL